MSLLDTKQIQEAQRLCNEIPLIKDRLMRAGLFQTMHRMDEVTRCLGYEVSDLMSGKRTPVNKKGRRIKALDLIP